jgi:hypothetical protein
MTRLNLGLNRELTAIYPFFNIALISSAPEGTRGKGRFPANAKTRHNRSGLNKKTGHKLPGNAR